MNEDNLIPIFAGIYRLKLAGSPFCSKWI